MLFALNRGKTVRLPRIAIGVVGVLLLGVCPARAEDPPRSGQSGDAAMSARGLVEEVLRKAGGEGEDSLGAWTRGVIDRALERAGETARQTVPGSGSGTGPGQATPLPAERHAARIAGGPAGRPVAAEILIFTSLSVPAASWRQWARNADALGVPLVLRGVGVGGLRQTAGTIRARLDGHEPGIAIDPRLFRLFGIERVPAVVVVPGGVPPCESRGCSNDPAPPHDLVAGNIGLIAAMEAVASEGDVGREVAKAHLGRLREGSRP